ncbi:MAG TPA: RNA polymerase sigma-54 factor, partial [Chthoniobacterales bacterium]
MAGSGMHQSQNMSLQQVLAPQLQQSLAILQAPMLELRNIIQQEIQTNPVIEEDITEPSIEDKQREMDDFKDEFEKLAKLDEEWR